ncbi:amidase [Aeromicrobium ginsengisoli]|uniref:Amidase n=1 Tax=Aeromicrobium ginsengisoli TaxID=363867 RepID=A0A5M4FFA2_9ACTN|nr:amidase [Aeromicrobium ginsengisoli]KAA1397796.1 amidase [Aeromicrobium ginsengisoli]
MSAEDLAFAPAHQLVSSLALGEVTSRELVDIYLERIGRLDGPLNSIITLDPERARTEADAADERRAAGEELGPLHGLPITTKDSYETKGMRSSCGRTDLADHVPTQDAEAVARLRRAGAIVMGKTNMPPGNQDVQADNPLFGPTNNPWNLGRTSGGSAGGGAVATVAGLTGFDFGSEIGGSTRIPSHFVGLYGHKATYRSIPLVGHLVPGPGVKRWSEPDLACAGAQVRDARDLVPILRATTGPMERDGGFHYELAEPRATALKDFRVAVWFDDPDCPVDGEVKAAMFRSVDALERAGATVDVHPSTIPVTIGESHSVFQPLLFSQLSIDRSGMTPGFGATMLARIAQNPRSDAARAFRGTFMSHHAWMEADALRQEIRERWTRFFDAYDIVLMPVSPTAAPPHHGKLLDKFGRRFEVDGQRRPYWDQVKWCGVANVAGTPATTIPAGLGSRSGLPIGVQAMGPAGGDLTTIEFAALLGAELGGFRRPA